VKRKRRFTSTTTRSSTGAKTGAKTGDATRPAAQFSIAAIMWTTFTLAAVLGYLRSFSLTVAMLGVAVLMTSALTAVLVGSVVRQVRQAVYWGVLGAAFAFTCVVGVVGAPTVMQIGWGMAGGLAGAVAGAIAATKKNQPWLSILGGAVTGTLVIAGCCLYRNAFNPESAVDIISAALATGGLAAVIEVIRWIEIRHHTPRYRTAAGLITAVIAGNLFADWIMTM